MNMSSSERYTGWRKSSHSGPSGGDCLEVAGCHLVVPVRDSKSPQGPVLVFPGDGWSSFVSAVRTGALGRKRRSA
ncbi:DUF397 domain-containing protein [Streptomyces niveus]|uniref:DUF397 domain-containing protein n=1 Tax=Streptomyces niveus TaxID=193462 RepID=UPI0036830E01